MAKLSVGDGFNFMLGALLAVIVIWTGVRAVLHIGEIGYSAGEFLVAIGHFLYFIASSPVFLGFMLALMVMIWLVVASILVGGR